MVTPRYRSLEEIFAKRREGLLKLTRGEELTYEEKELLHNFLNFETWGSAYIGIGNPM